jgi:hypothetical protein
MSSLKRCIATVLLCPFPLLAACNAGGAVDLYTSILYIQTANFAPLGGVSCNILNVSSHPRSGTISIVAGDGTVLTSVSYNNVAPGVATGNNWSNFSGSSPVTLVYCHLTVNKLPGEKVNVTASSIRGSLIRTDTNGNTLVIAEAR